MHNIYLGPVNNIFVFKQAGAELCQAQNKLSWVRLDWSNWLNVLNWFNWLRLLKLSNQFTKQTNKLIILIKLIQDDQTE